GSARQGHRPGADRGGLCRGRAARHQRCLLDDPAFQRDGAQTLRPHRHADAVHQVPAELNRVFLPFFLELKAARVPVSLREYLTLLEGMGAGLVTYDVEGFYYLSRAALVKDERHIDRFDQVFSHVFKGVEAVSGEGAVDVANLPEEWLRRLAEKHLSDEEKKLVEALGGFEKLMETLKERLEEQKGRHQGGSKWIG